jgi:hypothetical protein
MTLLSLVRAKQDKEVRSSAPYFKEQKAGGEKPYNCAKRIILPNLAKPILKEYLTLMIPQPEFTRF